MPCRSDMLKHTEAAYHIHLKREEFRISNILRGAKHVRESENRSFEN